MKKRRKKTCTVKQMSRTIYGELLTLFYFSDQETINIPLLNYLLLFILDVAHFMPCEISLRFISISALVVS